MEKLRGFCAEALVVSREKIQLLVVGLLTSHPPVQAAACLRGNSERIRLSCFTTFPGLPRIFASVEGPGRGNSRSGES